MTQSSELKEVSGNETWVSTGVATRRLNVCSKTLYKWERDGKIEAFQTPGEKWRWNVDGYLNRQRELLRQRREREHQGVAA